MLHIKQNLVQFKYIFIWIVPFTFSNINHHIKLFIRCSNIHFFFFSIDVCMNYFILFINVGNVSVRPWTPFRQRRTQRSYSRYLSIYYPTLWKTEKECKSRWRKQKRIQFVFYFHITTLKMYKKLCFVSFFSCCCWRFSFRKRLFY